MLIKADDEKTEEEAWEEKELYMDYIEGMLEIEEGKKEC